MIYRDMNIFIVVLAFIALAHPEDIAPPTARLVAESLDRLLMKGTTNQAVNAINL
jgi:hypothetical protein